MHNRARLVVGSFLTKDLGIDWRWGERWFMRMLIDGDEANNNGNWQWIASVGVDPQPVYRRIYNPARHQERYDPRNEYVLRYVPELDARPGAVPPRAVDDARGRPAAERVRDRRGLPGADRRPQAGSRGGARPLPRLEEDWMDYRIELIAIPVSDPDRAKQFYVEQAGFNADHDHKVSDELRFIQLTPPGSACSICLGEGITPAEPGSVVGMQMVVDDIETAHSELSGPRRRGQRDRPPAVRRVRLFQGSRRQRMGDPGNPRAARLERVAEGQVAGREERRAQRAPTA